MLLLSGALLAAVLSAGRPVPEAPCPSELFRIERNLNANAVVYRMTAAGNGGTRASPPVEAHWIMLADRGQVERLSLLERLTAYGFDVRTNDAGGFTVFLRACRERPIEVREIEGCMRALLPIQGRPAILSSVFVKMREPGGFSLESIALRGFDLQTGDAVEERLSSEASGPKADLADRELP